MILKKQLFLSIDIQGRHDCFVSESTRLVVYHFLILQIYNIYTCMYTNATMYVTVTLYSEFVFYMSFFIGYMNVV